MLHNGVMMQPDACYRILASRDPRFDGVFFAAVTSTGVYCRPSCPARTPHPENVRFYPTAAAAQREGFRACKRCRPDASPGSPAWNARADIAGRAMRLILDGALDREGVPGLARRLGYSERQLGRVLQAELGAGPLALARAQRAQTARILLQATSLPAADVAFAAGFKSVRQFNATIQDVYRETPTSLRRSRAVPSGPTAPEVLRLRLPYRPPLAWDALLAFLGTRAVPGVEAVANGTYQRVLSLPHGLGVAAARAAESEGASHLHLELELQDLRDLPAAIERMRRLLDLDADPAAIGDGLGDDGLLGAFWRTLPGLRVPSTVDGSELALRAVLGQQVSVAGARTLAGRLAQRWGEPLPAPRGALLRAFPEPGRIAALDPRELGMPQARAHALIALAAALAAGRLTLDPAADRDAVAEDLLALRGIGPWTVQYVRMRALGDPDAFLPADLGVRRALEALGLAGDPRSAAALAEHWRPWRAYAVQYLWRSLDPHARERGTAEPVQGGW